MTGFVVETVDEAVAATARAIALDRRRCRAAFDARFTADAWRATTWRSTRRWPRRLDAHGRERGIRAGGLTSDRMSVAPEADDGGSRPIRSTSCAIVAGRRARVSSSSTATRSPSSIASATSAPVGLAKDGLYHDGTRYLSRLALRLGRQRPLLLSSAVARRQLAHRRRPDQPGHRSRTTWSSSRAARCTSLATLVLRDGALHERLTCATTAWPPVTTTVEPRVRRRLRRHLRGARHASRATRRTARRPSSTRDGVVLGYAASTADAPRPRVALQPAAERVSRPRRRVRCPPRAAGGAQLSRRSFACEPRGAAGRRSAFSTRARRRRPDTLARSRAPSTARS